MSSQASPIPIRSEAAEDYLERVRGLATTITDSAEQAETDRRLPAGLVAALHDAGMFRLLLPHAYGGAEMDPPAFFQTIEAVAKLDASTAWCLCQGNGCAMAAAYLEPDVANEIWGNDPAGVLAWGPGGSSTARPDGDGYRLTGKWSFASGMHHATWLGGQCTMLDADGEPQRTADDKTIIRTLLFPIAKAENFDIWNVIGLRGTGSDGYTVDDMFVPRQYLLSRDDPDTRRYHAPLYLFRQMSLYASGFSGTSLGIARTMLESFKELAGEKTPRMARQRLADNAAIQADVAQAEARLGSARAFMLSELDDIWQTVVASNEVTVEQRMRIRLASTYGIHEAKTVASLAYDLAGATAIFESSPFERRFRDIHTVAQQLQGRKSHFHSVGAFLLGNPPDLTVA